MKPPAFQFYADDFVSGVSDMTQCEVGAYILLLCHQWNTGSIPSDQERLKIIAKGNVSDHVISKFENGKNKRMEQVRANLMAYRQRQSEAGRIGMKQRWNKGDDKVVMFPLLPEHNSPSPSPSPTTKTTKLRQSSKEKWPAFKAQTVSLIESCLGNEWENDRSKWLKRIKNEYHKAERVIAEVKCAITEKRIKTTPAAYAEQIWKEFE